MSSKSAEAAVVQLFTEVRRQKPSVIYIPNVDIWYRTLEDKVISTFLGLLRSIPPTDPVLLLGVLEGEETEDERDANAELIKRLFGFSKRNQFELQKPSRVSDVFGCGNVDSDIVIGFASGVFHANHRLS